MLIVATRTFFVFTGLPVVNPLPPPALLDRRWGRGLDHPICAEDDGTQVGVGHIERGRSWAAAPRAPAVPGGACRASPSAKQRLTTSPPNGAATRQLRAAAPAGKRASMYVTLVPPSLPLLKLSRERACVGIGTVASLF